MAIDLTPAKLADIKKKAEAAKDVKWPTIEQFPQHEEYPAAALMAAADPATVLAMVDEIETLKTALNLHMWEYWGTDLEQEDIDDLCKKQIQMAKKYRESEATP